MLLSYLRRFLGAPKLEQKRHGVGNRSMFEKRLERPIILPGSTIKTCGRWRVAHEQRNACRVFKLFELRVDSQSFTMVARPFKDTRKRL
jgi:hypothetical protein